MEPDGWIDLDLTSTPSRPGFDGILSKFEGFRKLSAGFSRSLTRAEQWAEATVLIFFAGRHGWTWMSR